MRRSKRKFNVDTMERANMEDRTKKQKIPENDNDSTSSLGVRLLKLTHAHTKKKLIVCFIFVDRKKF